MTQKQMGSSGKTIQSVKNAEKLDRKTGYIIVIVLLFALLIGTNVFAYSGVWFKLLPNTNPIYTLGKTATVDLLPNSSNTAAFTFKGAAIRGVYYQHPIMAQMTVTSQNFVVRAKMTVQTESQQIPVQIATDSNWIVGDDGYAYFENLVTGGQKILVANGYVLPDFCADQSKSYNLCLIVETLEQNTDFDKIWSLPQDFELLTQTID